MSKKLLLTAVCLLAIPMFVSSSGQSSNKQALTSPAVSLAGEIMPGARCDCSAPGCVCPSAVNSLPLCRCWTPKSLTSERGVYESIEYVNRRVKFGLLAGKQLIVEGSTTHDRCSISVLACKKLTVVEPIP